MSSRKSLQRIYPNPNYSEKIIKETNYGVFASEQYPQNVEFINETRISLYFNYYDIINMARGLNPHMPFKPYEPAQNIDGLGEIHQRSSQDDINRAIQQAISETNERERINITNYQMSDNDAILGTNFSNYIKILLIAMNTLNDEKKREAYNTFMNNPTGVVPIRHTLRKGGMRKTYRKSRRHNKISKNTKVRNNRKNRKTRSNRKTIKH